MTREEHLSWCKARARIHLNEGMPRRAWYSFVLDMRKHPLTSQDQRLLRATLAVISGQTDCESQVLALIEEFK